MEIPKTIDEFLDRYPCGYSDSWRKIINKHAVKGKMNFKVKFFGSKERKERKHRRNYKDFGE